MALLKVYVIAMIQVRLHRHDDRCLVILGPVFENAGESDIVKHAMAVHGSPTQHQVNLLVRQTIAHCCQQFTQPERGGGGMANDSIPDTDPWVLDSKATWQHHTPVVCSIAMEPQSTPLLKVTELPGWLPRHTAVLDVLTQP